ncbi:MAG: diaminopimelate epimerase [Proteobacteria bacterium]|nr:diaminopimelate epimerase [Pseudomonadota bacterium]MDA1287749.1 diaminopimelate epimerase [Pseudomonadota bacterium]
MDQDWLKSGIPFRKMHGLGNDFVVVDARGKTNPVSSELARAIGDRHFGVGFDQLAVILDANDADARLEFWNADGSLAATCGNATRCIAGLIFADTGRSAIILRTERGLLACRDLGAGLYSVNMGEPQLEWSQVPLAHPLETLHLPIPGDPVALGMGNPHCVFFVEDADAVDLATRGAALENHPLFPERTNVEFVQVISQSELRLKIWERGVGVTLASGSCSCASVVAAARRGLTDRKCRVVVDGGALEIDWRDDGVWMTGPTAHVFDGVFTSEFLAGTK